MSLLQTVRSVSASTLALLGLFSISLPAFAEEQPSLSKLIACHQILEERSTGTSEKLIMEKGQATPFVFKSGAKYIFVTDSTMSVLGDVKTADGKVVSAKGQVFAVTLTNQAQELKYQVEIRKNGDIGSVCCSNSGTKMRPDLPVGELSTQLTPATRTALTNELYTRLKTVTGEYQNDTERAKTAVEDLRKCEGIRFKDDIVAKLIKRYSPRTKNAYGAPIDAGRNSSYGTKKAR